MSTPTGTFKQFSFAVPTTNSDGSAITAAEGVSYEVFCDTANPPVTEYAVPAAQAAAVVNGVLTVTFAQLGFKPASGTTYNAFAIATDAAGNSVPSNQITFEYVVVPNAPTLFAVG